MPLQIYYPGPLKDTASPSPPSEMGHPVVLFSTPLGRNRTRYRPLCNELASHGYISVVLEHPGTSMDLFKALKQEHSETDVVKLLRPAIERTTFEEPWRVVDRMNDLNYLIANLEPLLAQHKDELPKADTHNLALYGHSFGGITVLMVLGAQVHPPPAFQGPLEPSQPDLSKIKLGMVSSPEVWDECWGLADARNYATIPDGLPVLTMSGVADKVEAHQTVKDYKERLVPFLGMASNGKRMHLLQTDPVESTHDRDESKTYPREGRQQQALTLAMADAYLKNRPEAFAYFESGLRKQEKTELYRK